MSTVDSAIAAIQDIVLASSDVTIKVAPDYPISDATAFPIVITHLVAGEANGNNATTTQFLNTASVDVHFARINLKDTYQKIDAVAVEFPRRLHGNPTLSGAVDTIYFPVTFAVSPAEWNGVVTQMLSFQVTFKTLETPISS